MVRGWLAVERAEQIPHPLLRQIFAYWQAKAASRGALPSRADIDPLDLGAALPAVSLIEMRPDDRDGAGRLRYRVMGSLHVEITGRDATGELIDLGSAESDAASAAIATGRPILAEREFSPANGCSVDMLLCAVAPRYRPGDLPASRVNRFARAAL